MKFFNKDLQSYLRKMIENGDFREDLYHRLGVILIQVPALNDRIDDVPLLAEYFLNQFQKTIWSNSCFFVFKIVRHMVISLLVKFFLW